jgi:hypothetical protein
VLTAFESPRALWQIAVTSGIPRSSAANLGLKNWSDGWRFSYGSNIYFSLFLFLGCLVFVPGRLVGSELLNEDRLKESLAKLRYEDGSSPRSKPRKKLEEDRAIGNATWAKSFRLATCAGALCSECSFQGFPAALRNQRHYVHAPTFLNTFFTVGPSTGTFGLSGINCCFITVFGGQV